MASTFMGLQVWGRHNDFLRNTAAENAIGQRNRSMQQVERATMMTPAGFRRPAIPTLTRSFVIIRAREFF